MKSVVRISTGDKRSFIRELNGGRNLKQSAEKKHCHQKSISTGYVSTSEGGRSDWTGPTKIGGCM